jgi:hypothetical protein
MCECTFQKFSICNHITFLWKALIVGLRKHRYIDHLSFVVRLEGLAILRYLFGFPAMESSGQSLNKITLFMKTFEKVCEDVDNLVTSIGVSLSHQVFRYHFLACGFCHCPVFNIDFNS